MHFKLTDRLAFSLKDKSDITRPPFAMTKKTLKVHIVKVNMQIEQPEKRLFFPKKVFVWFSPKESELYARNGWECQLIM